MPGPAAQPSRSSAGSGGSEGGPGSAVLEPCQRMNAPPHQQPHHDLLHDRVGHHLRVDPRGHARQQRAHRARGGPGLGPLARAFDNDYWTRAARG